MCLVAFAIDQSRRYPLVVASNRDEFFERPTARLAWWHNRPADPAILSGRDLESGGTWMGLTATGRLAMLTNVRGAIAFDKSAPSRGRIVTDWLSAREDTGDFWMRTSLSGYNGFNLVAADFARGECFWASNVSAHPQRLERGVHGLSNGALDAPWPKVRTLKSALETSIDAAAGVDDLAARLFAALGDRTIAADASLPQTGIPLERERQLSSAFIRTADQSYGTRCSTLIITERQGRQPITHVFERTYNPSGTVALLRRASLRNWPPRYVQEEEGGRIEESEVSETDDVVLGATAPKRTRVRSLLKPAVDKRRKRGAVEVA